MKKLLISSLILLNISSCSVYEKREDIKVPEIQQNLVVSSGVTIETSPVNQEIIKIDEDKTYSNPHYNIQFDYPSDFTIESHSGVMSWDEAGNVDQFEDNLIFSGARGSFALIFPNDTVYIGRAPLYGKKDEMVNIGRFQVQKHIEFGSQDNPGPNQQGIWSLIYTVDIAGKKYRFQTSQEGIFSEYNISTDIDMIIQEAISTIKL